MLVVLAIHLHSDTQYACIVIADLSQRLAQSGGIRAPRNEPEASTDNRSHQSTGLHPSIPGRLAHLLHIQYPQTSRIQIQAAPRTRRVNLVLVSTPTSRTCQTRTELGTMVSSHGSTSATQLPSLSGPSTSSDQSSWLSGMEKRRRSSPEASSSRNPFVRDRRSSAVDEHDELEEEKKPTKRMSTGSANGLTSQFLIVYCGGANSRL